MYGLSYRILKTLLSGSSPLVFLFCMLFVKKGMLDFVMSSPSTEKTCASSLVLLLWYIISGFSMMNQSGVSGINSPWSWCIILFTCCEYI